MKIRLNTFTLAPLYTLTPVASYTLLRFLSDAPGKACSMAIMLGQLANMLKRPGVTR